MPGQVIHFLFRAFKNVDFAEQPHVRAQYMTRCSILSMRTALFADSICWFLLNLIEMLFGGDEICFTFFCLLKFLQFKELKILKYFSMSPSSHFPEFKTRQSSVL
jgi:hypothetical protein